MLKLPKAHVSFRSPTRKEIPSYDSLRPDVLGLRPCNPVVTGEQQSSWRQQALIKEWLDTVYLKRVPSQLRPRPAQQACGPLAVLRGHDLCPAGPGPVVTVALAAPCDRRCVWEAENLGYHAEGAPLKVRVSAFRREDQGHCLDGRQ